MGRLREWLRAARGALLATIDWMMDLTRPIFSVGGHGISWRDVILIGGGLFLLYKAAHGIKEQVKAHWRRLQANTGPKTGAWAPREVASAG